MNVKVMVNVQVQDDNMTPEQIVKWIENRLNYGTDEIDDRMNEDGSDPVQIQVEMTADEAVEVDSFRTPLKDLPIGKTTVEYKSVPLFKTELEVAERIFSDPAFDMVNVFRTRKKGVFSRVKDKNGVHSIVAKGWAEKGDKKETVITGFRNATNGKGANDKQCADALVGVLNTIIHHFVTSNEIPEKS